MGATSSPEAPGEARTLASGERIDRFVVVRVVGTGGMGVVYEARDPDLERSVALKVLRSESEHGAVRLMREAQALAQLAHPNVVAVHEVGIEGNRCFIAMEYVPGVTLAEHLATPRPTREVLGLFVQAGRGLAAAHERSLVHRDFKPGNVLVDTAGRVHVTDFGLARLAAGADEEPAGDARHSFEEAETVDVDEAPTPPASPAHGLLGAVLTGADAIIGTPRYMSPEQAQRRAATAKSDQYSFCVALWEAVFGALPPQRARAGPRWLIHALETGLAHDPAARHGSMQELVDLLERTPTRRRRLALGAAGLLLAGGALAGVLAPRGVDCDAARARVDGLWKRDAVARAFLATGKPNAADVFARVDRAMQERLRRWSAAHTDACAATHERGEQSEALLDQRMQCLERARRRMENLVQVWQTGAPDLDGAVKAAASDDVAACADPESLASSVPPPADAAAVEALRRELDAIDALKRATRLGEGLVRARTAVVAARGLAYPPVLAEALFRAGELEGIDSRFEPAIAVLEEAARVAGEARDDALLVNSYIKLIGHLGNDMRRWEAATALFTAGEASAARLPARDDLRAELLRVEAGMLQAQGRHAQAAERAQQALALFERTAGPGHPDHALFLHVLAMAKESLGQWEESLELQRGVLASLERTLGDHPRTASALNNLAISYGQRGDFAKNAEYAERSLALRERLYGPDHPQVALGLVTLANARGRQNRHDDARVLLERALAIRTRAFGPEHGLVGQTVGYLAFNAMQRKDLPAAAELYERALVIAEKANGPKHPSLAVILTGLGEARRNLGDRNAARIAYMRALAIFRAGGEGESERDATLRGLGNLALESGDLKQARARFRDVLEYQEKLYRGADHPRLVRSLLGMGKVHLAEGKPDEARPLLERALRIAEGTTVDLDLIAEVRAALAKATR